METKELKQLDQALPEDVFLRWTTDKDGDEICVGDGFEGNLSASDDYVTDGHVLLLAEAVPAHLKADIRDQELCEGQRKVTAQRQQVLLSDQAKRETLGADFIGCAKSARFSLALDPEDFYTLAVIRDAKQRILIVNAYLFAFALKYTEPDRIAVDACVMYQNQSLQFWKGDKLVALVMPMKVSAIDIADYDMEGALVDVFGGQR